MSPMSDEEFDTRLDRAVELRDAERAVVSAAEQWASSQIVGVAELVAERERAFWRAVDALLSLREGT